MAVTAQPVRSVTLLGEVHDNPFHHAFQVCAAEQIAPKALVFEMITPGAADALTFDDRASVAALGRVLELEAAGWSAFEDYYRIILAAPEARVYGAAIPRPAMRGAFAEGAAAQFTGDAEAFGLTKALPEAEQSAREEMQYNAHCKAMGREMMSGMVEAQRLRDAELARATLQALDDTGGPVLVILGNGHARNDWGVPVYLRTVRPAIDVLSVGMLEGQMAAQDPAIQGRFDLPIGFLPAERDDPCGAFE